MDGVVACVVGGVVASEIKNNRFGIRRRLMIETPFCIQTRAIISTLFQWFVATIIIIAKKFQILQFRG